MTRRLLFLTATLGFLAGARALAGAPDAAPAAATDPITHVPTSWRSDAFGTPLDAAALAKLGKGEILSGLVDVPNDPVKKGMAIGIIDATPQKVFATCGDYEHFPDFMPYVSKTTVDAHETGTSTVSYWLEFPLGIGNRNYQLKLLDGTKTVDGEKVYTSDWTFTGKGNIKDTSGSWQIAPWGDGKKSFVRYICFTDPGGSIPNWMKNMASKTAIPKVVQRVRERVASEKAAKPVEF
jgi:hypothetical protein